MRVGPDHLGVRLEARGFRWKRAARATAHEQPDPDRQEDAAAGLALLPCYGGWLSWG